MGCVGGVGVGGCHLSLEAKHNVYRVMNKKSTFIKEYCLVCLQLSKRSKIKM